MNGSIRWRLVASYVLMTLLTVGVMGGLALSLVWRYVDRREAEILTANAEAVARHALPLVASTDRTEELDELARSSAFLINARVRLLDARQQVLADSGPVTETDQLIWIAAPGAPMAGAGLVGGQPPGAEAESEHILRPGGARPHVVGVAAIPLTEESEQAFNVPLSDDVPLSNALELPARSPAPLADPAARQPVAPAPLASAPDPLTTAPGLPGGARITVVRRQIGPWGDRLAFDVIHDTTRGGSPIAATRHFSFSAALSAPDFLALEPAGVASNPALPARSIRGVRVPVGGSAAAMGYVEISQGPDLVGAAVGTTARAFGIAALGAALLAGIVGLVVSRGMTAPVQSLAAAASQMSAGDLSARAPVQGRDELAELARQFNTMAERLETSFADLEAERDALRRFIADASHELRTPITALRSFNELLQTGAAADPAARAEFLAESQAQIRRLAWITANLLDLSRLDAGLVELDRMACNPADLIEAALAPLRPLAAEREIHLSVQSPSEPLTLTCDAARVELALSNLLDNALKFTPRGGHVEIGVLRRLPSEHPRTPPRVAFWVRDDGPGIVEDELPYLFDRFFRGRCDPAAATEGSGLGLAIVRGVAQIHGGEAWADGMAGTGACFWLALPDQRREGG